MDTFWKKRRKRFCNLAKATFCARLSIISLTARTRRPAGTENYGVVLESSSSAIYHSSRTNVSSGVHPYFTIVYVNSTGLESRFSYSDRRPAVVRVSYEAEDEPAPVEETVVVEAVEVEVSAPAADEPADYAAVRQFLTGLLDRMGVKANIAISARDNGGINVELSGSGMGAIIGRRGETLDAIQHLTNYVVNRGSEKHLHISVDAENYRSKREESLTKLAEKMAEKAIKYKRSMALEPMNSYERHVIHTALQNYEGVTTSSTGVEPNRRVVVSYVKPEGGNKPQSREWA